jgi:hypothetical protein
MPDRETVDGDNVQLPSRGEPNIEADRPERRFRVIKKPDGTYYMERHVGSIAKIQGRISIYDTHKEAVEAMRDMG